MVNLRKRLLGYWNDRLPATRTMVIPDLVGDLQLQLVARDGRQLAVIGNGMSGAELDAQPAERALTGKKIPGDSDLVLF